MKNAKFYSQAMMLFDRLSALPTASVTRETETIARRLSTSSSSSAPSLPMTSSPSVVSPSRQTRTAAPRAAESKSRRPSRMQENPSVNSVTEASQAELWTEVARLLTKSGAWTHALGLMDGLTPSLRTSVAQTAVGEAWPMPPDVLLSVRLTTQPSPLKPKAKGPVSEPTHSKRSVDTSLETRKERNGRHTTAGVRGPSGETQSRRQRDEYSFTGHKSPGTGTSWMGLTADELLTRAFACRRPATPEAARDLGEEQQSILHELRRRGMVEEALQCVVNWRTRGLVMDRFYASTMAQGKGEKKRTLTPASSDRAASTAGDSAGLGAPVVRQGVSTELESPFDAIAVVRDMLFPPPTAEPVARPPTGRHAWQIAIASFPLLFARCVRDGAACEAFVRNGTATHAEVYSVMSTLLRCLGGAVARAPSAAISTGESDRKRRADTYASFTVGNDLCADVEVLWRAVSRLAKTAQPFYRQETKAVKERLLLDVATALEATARLGPVPKREAAEVKPVAVITSKARAAMQGTVESLCSCLPQHEAQVRFMRMTLFARLGLALEAIDAGMLRAQQQGMGLTNGLVQCLFLCLGDAHYRYSASSSNEVSGNVRAADSSLGQERRERTESAAPSALEQFLSCEPLARYEPALALAQQARADHWFRVSPTHLHSLLSGLQSVSIVKTWQEALMCVEFFEKQLRILPDDSTTPILVLNYAQDSWRRAFHVLRYYEEKGVESGLSTTGGHAAAAWRRRPPAALMRDLHLLSIKNGAWTATLRIMDQLLALDTANTGPLPRHPRLRAEAARAVGGGGTPSASTYVGFMNYLYSLYAAGLAGRPDLCHTYFRGLERAPGQRAGTSPFNEVTVAVAAVALLDSAHYAEATSFATSLLSESASASEPATAHPSSSSLTPAGRETAEALLVTALLSMWHRGRPSAASQRAHGTKLVTFLNQLLLDDDGGMVAEAQSEAPSMQVPRLRQVLTRAVTLDAMCGLSHLRAPIRLVYDTVAGPGAYEDSASGAGTMETRQVTYHRPLPLVNPMARGMNDGVGFQGRGSRSAHHSLYIPPSHRLARAKRMAEALGSLVKASEGGELCRGGKREAQQTTKGTVELSPDVVRTIAEAMSACGAGPDFLKASLL